MQSPERSVLHVLPHAGGGGDTYVDVLGHMEGYRFERVYVTPQRKPGVGEVAAGLWDLRRVLRGYDLVHVHGEGAAAMFLPILAARRSVVTLHGLHLLRRVGGIPRRAAALNLRALLRAASSTICVSNAERDQLAEVVGPISIRRAVVVHNGARLALPTSEGLRTSVRGELDLDDSVPLAIWVGSLDERRDPFAVARAAMRTSTPFLFVGEGPLRAELERTVQPPVHVLGPRSDVPRLLAAADVFVLMSQREGLSFALLEAMAHGLPAIIADIPENLEAIGDSGITVPYGDEDAVATALSRLGGDCEERAQLGARARRRVGERFSADDMIARTRAVYDSVLASE
jgi:glycosyltransferase involved in cell wall biosynthesis